MGLRRCLQRAFWPVLLLLCSSPLLAEGHIIVTLRSGERLEAPEHRVLSTFHVLEVTTAEGTRNLSFSDIDAIADAEGNDITFEEIGRPSRSSTPPSPSAPPAPPTPPIEANRLTPAPTGAEKQASLIRLTSGEEFLNVVYELRPAAAEMIIRSVGRPQVYRYTEIAVIRDAQGYDVTQTELARPEPPKEQAPAPPKSSTTEKTGAWVPRKSPTAGTRADSPWHTVLAIHPRFDKPSGEYYKGTDEDPGVGADLHIRLTDEFAVHAGFALLGVQTAEHFHPTHPNPNLELWHTNVTLRAYRYLIGLEYHRLWSGHRPRTGFWYVQGSLGCIDHSFDGEITLYDSDNYQFVTTDAGNSEIYFTSAIGAGITYFLSSKIGLEIGLDLNLVWADVQPIYRDNSTAMNGSIFGAHAGLAFRL